MRILLLTQRLPYAPNRGDRIRAYYLMRELSRFAKVSLFSFVHDEEEEGFAKSVEFADRVSVVRVTPRRNLARASVRLLSGTPLTHLLLDAPGAQSTLNALVASSPPDLVLPYGTGMARFAFAAPLARLPMVLDIVDVDSAKWKELGQTTPGPKRWIYRREARTLAAFEVRATARARTTIIVNERERDLLLQVSPEAHVDVVPNGIELAAFKPENPPVESLDVVFCGVMNYAPNEAGVLWFAREVWPKVLAEIPAARFIVVGSGETPAIRALADEASVEVTGRVPTVQPYLWRSAVSVAPLRLARGLQNKVLEALAAGLPVVVTPEVGAGLPTHASAGCISAKSAEDFSAAVVRLLRETPEARRARAMSAHVEQLSWTDQLRSVEMICDAAVNAR